MSEATKIIGSNIRLRREELRLPSVELANLLGRSQATISRMENGKIEITVSQLVKIAGILKTTPARLFPHFDSMVTFDAVTVDMGCDSTGCGNEDQVNTSSPINS